LRTLTRALCLAALLAVAGDAARGQEYPLRPVRAIGASSAGGISDIFMRVLGEELHKRLGQPIIVENRPGGNFNIAARACVEAPPDGYTVCILPGETVSYNQFLFKNIGYDPDKDLAPITNLFFLTQVMAVSAKLEAKTLAELAALSKAKPGTLSYTAPALSQAVFVEKFKQDMGADLVRVPFKGGGEAITGMISGATPVVFLGLGNVISHLREGLARGLVVDSEQRSPLFPDIPTLAQVGYGGDVTRSYFGLFAPPGTPAPVIARLQAEIAGIVREQGFGDKHLVQRGLEPAVNTPGEFAAFIRRDRQAAERVVRQSGLVSQ
jgi:tripartite-type tricarboxylate transporter receptor subunit TctC